MKHGKRHWNWHEGWTHGRTRQSGLRWVRRSPLPLALPVRCGIGRLWVPRPPQFHQVLWTGRTLANSPVVRVGHVKASLPVPVSSTRSGPRSTQWQFVVWHPRIFGETKGFPDCFVWISKSDIFGSLLKVSRASYCFGNSYYPDWLLRVIGVIGAVWIFCKHAN